MQKTMGYDVFAKPEPMIIALSGKKGSGKNTVSSFIRDYFSRCYKGPRNGILFCIEFAFADLLKQFCIDVLGLEHKQCYGTDEEKNTLTKYRWDTVQAQGLFKDQFNYGDNEYMTGREVMQIFGTESVRAWFGNVWAEATLRKIKEQSPVLAIVTDNRFSSEVEIVLGHSRGYIIRLTRDPFGEDSHSSETALDNYDWNRERCFVLDNAALSKEEQIEAIKPILDNIFSEELGNE